jgi:hypothetical protein
VRKVAQIQRLLRWHLGYPLAQKFRAREHKYRPNGEMSPNLVILTDLPGNPFFVEPDMVGVG